MGALDKFKKKDVAGGTKPADTAEPRTVEEPVSEAPAVVAPAVPEPVAAAPAKPAPKRSAPRVTTPTPAPQSIAPKPEPAYTGPALSVLLPSDVMAMSAEEVERAKKAESGRVRLPEAPAARVKPEPVKFRMVGGDVESLAEADPDRAKRKEDEDAYRLAEAARDPGIRARAQELVNDKGLQAILSDPAIRQSMPDQVVRKWRESVKIANPTMTDEQAQEKAWRDMALLRTVGIWTGASGPLSPVDTDPDSLLDASKPVANVIGLDRDGVPVIKMQEPGSYAADLLMMPGHYAIATGVPDVIAQQYFGEARDPDTKARLGEQNVKPGMRPSYRVSPDVIRERRSFSDVAKDTDQTLYADRLAKTVELGLEAATGEDYDIELSPLQRDIAQFAATATVATAGAGADVFAPDPVSLAAVPVKAAGRVLGVTGDLLEAYRTSRALAGADDLARTTDEIKEAIVGGARTSDDIRAAATKFDDAATKLGKDAPQVAGFVEDAALTVASRTGRSRYGSVLSEVSDAAKAEAASGSRVGSSMRAVADAVDAGRVSADDASALIEAMMDRAAEHTRALSAAAQGARLLPTVAKSAAVHLLGNVSEASQAGKALAKAKAVLDKAEATWQAASKVQEKVLVDAGIAVKDHAGRTRLMRAPATAAERRLVDGVARAQERAGRALKASRAEATAMVAEAADSGSIRLTQPEAEAVRDSMARELAASTRAAHRAKVVDELIRPVDEISSTSPVTSKNIADVDASFRKLRSDVRVRDVRSGTVPMNQADKITNDPEVAANLFASKVGRAAYQGAVVRTLKKVKDAIAVPFTGVSPMKEWELARLTEDMRDTALRSERAIAAVGADMSKLDNIDDVARYLSGERVVVGGTELPTSGSSFVSDFYMVILDGRAEARAVAKRFIDTVDSIRRGQGGAELGAEDMERAVQELLAVLRSEIEPVYRSRYANVAAQSAAEAAAIRRVYDAMGDAANPNLSKMMESVTDGASRARALGGWVGAETQLNREVSRMFADGAALTDAEAQALLALGEGAFAPPLSGAHADVNLMLAARRYFTPGVALDGGTFVRGADEIIPATKAPQRGSRDGRTASGVAGDSTIAMLEQEAARARGRAFAGDVVDDVEVTPTRSDAELDLDVTRTESPATYDWRDRARGAQSDQSGFDTVSPVALLESAHLPKLVRERLANAVVDAYKPKVSTASLNMLTAWKLSMTRGAIGVRPKYFFDNWVGDSEQIYRAFGLNVALKQVVRTTATTMLATVPSALLRTFGGPGAELVGNVGIAAFVGTERGAGFFAAVAKLSQDMSETVGRYLSAGSLRVETSAIIEGADKYIRVGDQLYSARELRAAAVAGGVFDTRNADVFMSTEGGFLDKARRAAERLGISPKLARDGVEQIAETIGLRQRVGLYSSLLEEGMKPDDAARGVVRALYDYRYTMTQAERSGVLQFIIPFWAYQKNANAQFLGGLLTPRGAYRTKVWLAGREVSRDLLQRLSTEINSQDGDDVGVLAGRIPVGDPAIEAYNKFLDLKKRTGSAVSDAQWNRLITSGSSGWGGSSLDAGEIALLREWTVPLYNDSMHRAYAGDRKSVSMGVVESTGPVGRRESLGELRAKSIAPDEKMPDVDTYWEVMYPQSSAEGALAWAMTGVGVALTMADAVVHPERNVNPLTVAKMAADPTRAPFLGTAIQTVTGTAKPVRISRALGDKLLATMPFLTESIRPIPKYKGEATSDEFYSEEYLKAKKPSINEELSEQRIPGSRERLDAADVSAAGSATGVKFDPNTTSGYEVSGFVANALQASGVASIVDRIYKTSEREAQYDPDKLRSFLSGLGLSTSVTSSEVEPFDVYGAQVQQNEMLLPKAEFQPARMK